MDYGTAHTTVDATRAYVVPQARASFLLHQRRTKTIVEQSSRIVIRIILTGLQTQRQRNHRSCVQSNISYLSGLGSHISAVSSLHQSHSEFPAATVQQPDGRAPHSPSNSWNSPIISTRVRNASTLRLRVNKSQSTPLAMLGSAFQQPADSM